MDETIFQKMFVLVQVTTFADRPGYERTSSSLWKQREEYCAILIQQAWRDHHKGEGKVRAGENVRHVVTGNKVDEKKQKSDDNQVIEVQPSPTPSK